MSQRVRQFVDYDAVRWLHSGVKSETLAFALGSLYYFEINYRFCLVV